MTERDVDAELVARVQNGDKKAFDLLVLKYQRKIMRLLSRMIRDPAETEDVAQEAFIKAYRALPQFRGDSAFYTWLYRIAINTARNWLATNKRRPSTSSSFENEEGETEHFLRYRAATYLRGIKSGKVEAIESMVTNGSEFFGLALDAMCVNKSIKKWLLS